MQLRKNQGLCCSEISLEYFIAKKNSPVGVHVAPALAKESTNCEDVTKVEALRNKLTRSRELAI